MPQSPKDILDTMLGYLGFAFEIQEEQRGDNFVLQVYTNDANLLIGKFDKTLDGIQYLVNRISQIQDPTSPRAVVDVEHHRAIRDDLLIQKAKQLADTVRRTGTPLQTDPLNSYDRRLVHNAFKDDPEIATWSPPR